MPGSEYYLKFIIGTEIKEGASVKKSVGSWTELKSQLGLVKASFDKVLQAAQKAYAFIERGAQVGRAARALDNLAKDAGTSGDALIKAMQESSDYTIDRMTAMEVANKALIMEVAKSPKEFERLTKVAVTLGRAMGVDAAGSIDRFVVASARKSIKIADDLGLVIDATKANEAYAAANNLLASELTAAEQSQAFLNEMLVQGERKIEALTDTSMDAATQMEQLSSSWKDMKSMIAESVAEEAAAAGTIEKTSQFIRDQTEMMELLAQATERAGGARIAMGRGHQAAVQAAIMTSRNWQQDEDELRAALEETNVAIGDQTIVLEDNEAALEASQAAAEAATVKQVGLAAAFFDVSQADIAKRAIGELGTLLDEDKITIDEYKTAVTETQLAFGLADEQSIWLADSVLALTARFGEGEVKASAFDDELAIMIDLAAKSREEVEKLGEAITALPDVKTVRVNIETSGGGGGGGNGNGGFEAVGPTEETGAYYGWGQHGGVKSGLTMVGERGPEMVDMGAGGQVYNNQQSTNISNAYNMTVNTRANSPSVQQDYRMMQARIG